VAVFLLNVGLAIAASRIDTGVFAIVPGVAALLAAGAYLAASVPRSRARTVFSAAALVVASTVAGLVSYLLLYVSALAGAHVMS
jgi:hypothetical protein